MQVKVKKEITVGGHNANWAFITAKLPEVMRYFGNDEWKTSIKRKANRQHIEEFIRSKNRTSFFGGTFEELSQKQNMRQYTKQKNEFKRSGIDRVVRENSTFEKKKRKRFRSEVDGDWQFDRRWESKPFESIRKTVKPMPILKINCRFAFSGGVNASEITKYGAIVWAIIDILEDHGKLCEVYFYCLTRGIVRTNKRRGVCVKILLKSPDQYLSPQALSRVFTGIFYRRVKIGLTGVGADAHGENVDEGAGQGIPFREAIKYENGELTIGNVSNTHTTKIKETLLSVIKEM